MPGALGFRSGAPSGAAFALRSLALFGILYQFRLFAGDLADTLVFITALILAFVLPYALIKRQVRPLLAPLILIAAPWIFRFCLAAPRYFFSLESGSAAIALDSLLLNLDRNAFVFLPSWYWAAFSSYFAARSRKFLRADSIISLWIVLIVFSVARTSDMDSYRWPVLMIGVFAMVIYFLLLALMFSLPSGILARRRDKIAGGITLFLLVLLGALALIRPSQERAVEKGGGLLQPNLFQFDFSQILRLENEIRMNDDLVLIVRKDPEDNHIFLRRFTLSGYSAKQGFFRQEPTDEISHPQKLPNGRISVPTPEMQLFREMDQEYFLVNFDSDAFIGMNAPTEIIPFESWDASSFRSAYGVKSYLNEAYPFELSDAVKNFSPDFSASNRARSLGLSPGEYELYTYYGNNERIAQFAREITRGFTSYWEMAQAILDRLRHGEYRYSLKPGIAPDGDQLEYFLFQSKRGYCSYYAFAMTLMLRSLGIPSRVAVGFFIDPREGALDYYPIRSDMAHAWVEVYYPKYGWIEYDPTTDQLAEDEDFQFSSGVPKDLFERLMREILDNRNRLTPRERGAEADRPLSIQSLRAIAGRFLRRWGLLLIAILLASAFTLIRSFWRIASWFTKNPRKKTLFLWVHAKWRLRLGGYKYSGGLGEGEWAKTLDARLHVGAYDLYQIASAAKYAPRYEDHAECLRLYRAFSLQYRREVSPVRRALAWLCPPLALGLRKAALFLALILCFALPSAPPPIRAQESSSPDAPGTGAETDADALFQAASEAQQVENWERAISLYSQGLTAYPEDERFPWALGSLYYNRGLYSLAWDEYRGMERLNQDDPNLLYRLSRTAGYLNQDALSADYLERLLEIDPDHREAIGNLGWMYYKLHRLEEGESLLLSAIERLGKDPDFSMTLGTIYSDMFRYDDAKTWYLDAIARGERLGDKVFAAVAHYNLSILESRFYHYADAFVRTGESLSSQNRASGRLSRGELFMRRLDLNQAFIEFQTAYEIDTSPLSKINLAQAYQIAGRLEEAKLYGEDCLTQGDLSWMLNYGIDQDRYKRDIHDILYKTYQGLAKTEGRLVYETIPGQIRGFFRMLQYYYKSLSHRYLFRKYSLLAGNAYGAHAEGGKGLDAQIQYYNAFEPYTRRSLEYLRNARDFEVPLIPQATASYDAEEGFGLGDKERLLAAIPRFDPLWERDLIADSYARLWLKGRLQKDERRDTAERLYALNRGALRQQGITLPVELALEISPNYPAGAERRLLGVLKKIGLDISNFQNNPEEGSARFRLRISLENENVFCELYDGGRGVSQFRRTIPLKSLTRKDIAPFSRELGDLLFVVGGD